MSHVFNEAKRAIAAGEIDFDAPNAFRLMLVMTNTTADTEFNVNTISAITTLDEMDGANYVRQIATSGAVINEDVGNNRAEFDIDDITWSSLGAGTRQVAGAVLYKHVTNDTDSVPIAYIDSGGFPFTANGGDVTLQFNVEGVLQFT